MVNSYSDPFFFLIRIYQDWQAQIKAAHEFFLFYLRETHEKVKGQFLHNNKN